MKRPEIQEIPEEASKKLILTIASNNQKALMKYIEELENGLKSVYKKLGKNQWPALRIIEKLLSD